VVGEELVSQGLRGVHRLGVLPPVQGLWVHGGIELGEHELVRRPPVVQPRERDDVRDDVEHD